MALEPVRPHERDSEVAGLPWTNAPYAGATWHQDGPDDAHERWHCSVESCGWAPPRAPEDPREGGPTPMPPRNPIPAPPKPGRLLCGGQYPDGTLCKVPAEIPHTHVIAHDLHAELAEGDLPTWSVESRLLLVTGRPMLARQIAQCLPHELGARLCDRLETLVQQAKDVATVELSNAVQAEASATMTRLAAEAREKLEAVRDERFGGHSRLS